MAGVFTFVPLGLDSSGFGGLVPIASASTPSWLMGSPRGQSSSSGVRYGSADDAAAIDVRAYAMTIERPTPQPEEGVRHEVALVFRK
jgi:hypothetical protein